MTATRRVDGHTTDDQRGVDPTTERLPLARPYAGADARRLVTRGDHGGGHPMVSRLVWATLVAVACAALYARHRRRLTGSGGETVWGV
jgi:hypothetical protein